MDRGKGAERANSAEGGDVGKHRPEGERQLQHAAEIMGGFADETGLTSGRPARRYLWTDALGVCTSLGLHEETGDDRWRRLALDLVDQVHRVLGWHRPDDRREGWISGLDEEEGARRPTAGGLRIGKEAPERGPSEPYRPREEWDRDGQYYHYLTRWAHALNRTWRVTGDRRYQRWAVELMQGGHGGFVLGGDPGNGGGGPRGRRSVAWKMSIDLSRPLVPTEGEHDPLDGLVTVRTLRATSPEDGDVLEAEERELAEMCRGRHWVTDDGLGLGGLLALAWWTAWLGDRGGGDPELLEILLRDAAAGLSEFERAAELDAPAGWRLAFRELGLATGLSAAERLVAAAGEGGEVSVPAGPADSLRDYLPLRREIEEFWLREEHRKASTWREHRDISRVALATSLAPGGYLDL